MHLQQTKRGSRISGGPQYYFHDLTDEVSHYLRGKKAVPVALVTPYGATPSNFLAVSSDAKFLENRVMPGKVGHDRIQQATAGESIGEAIRRWYRLPAGDFERIDVDVQILDAKFYVAPLKCKYAESKRVRELEKPQSPLSFNDRFRSQLWRRQLERVKKKSSAFWQWSLEEVCRVVAAHQGVSRVQNVQEQDLLRVSGSLKVLGLELGPYVGKGFDCESRFEFLDYEPYTVPVEVKKLSSRFKYQQAKYSPTQLSRVVILCVKHDLRNVPENVDVIQLTELCAALHN